ncbi:TRAP transporter substrate-binding protein DctP [Thalassovita sp.]|uniref:TRAP transporter substrate-binding protein DctP n=1 Tax=Thalassovita sp. TaxID=1979401 RepID=UPI0029DE883D|nr:TRAP transporter substrate-binding protein DctP [Thalassovita sp.]
MHMKIGSAALAAALAVASTAYAQEEVTLSMTTVWPEGINLIDSDRHFVETVNAIGAGKVQIDFMPGGTLVPSTEVFGAVQSGGVDMGTDWPGYWAGTDSTFSLLGSFPMLFTLPDYVLWVTEWGGQELFDEVYGKYGMKYLPILVVSTESGLRANKSLPNLAALEGARIRMSGRPQGQILEALGAAQVTLPGGEVYQALERGVVDAAEFSGPGIDLGMGFQEVTDFWQSPGWHQPGSLNGVMIDLKVWNNLSEEQQAILETAAHANMLWTIGYYEKGATEAVKAFAEADTQVETLSDEDLSRLQDIANSILVDEACQNPTYAKVAASQIEYLQDYGQWRGMQGEFAMGRNLSSLPDLEAIKACATE